MSLLEIGVLLSPMCMQKKAECSLSKGVTEPLCHRRQQVATCPARIFGERKSHRRGPSNRTTATASDEKQNQVHQTAISVLVWLFSPCTKSNLRSTITTAQNSGGGALSLMLCKL
ncbi:hypothetical protein H2248_002344 [Termitomyces sp. 'cryptogamus']|nr:hypothetical protein H2248_002344 [Termitomyces sp. 'cryptogamus']